MPQPGFPVLRVLAHLSLGLAQALAWLLLWLGLSAARIVLPERLGAQRYAPGDAPHPAFQVLALQDGGTPALHPLHALGPGMPLATQAPQSARQGEHGFTFTQTAPGVYELHADRDTFTSQAELPH